ncbi:cupin domain-containing protein [Vampirovibrio sp.]|uniref:cupin domain-containing protein n=1 Tax=Vampirovibrio sp. TaxID=2717857 RepID=UPI0035930ADA
MTTALQDTVHLLENIQFVSGKPAKSQIASIQGVSFIKIALKAGDELPSHHVNQAAFAVLLQGRATFPIDGKSHAVVAGSFVEIPKGAEHSIFAEEDSVFLVGIMGAVSEGEC